MSRYSALAGRVRASLTDIQTTVDRANLLGEEGASVQAMMAIGMALR